MKKRSRLWAILGASVLTLGVVTIALAVELKDAHQGLTITWDAEGNPVLPEGFSNSTECPEVPGEGEVIFHFVQSGQDTNVNDGGVAANLLDVSFTGADDQTGVEADSIQNDSNVDWFVWATVTGDTLVLDNAESNVPGGDDDLRVSHICAGDNPPDEETEAPSFEQSQEGETDAPSEPPSDAPSDEVTDAPSFEQSQEGETEPPTNTIGGKDAAPGDGAWLLVVALGVLLASIVVLSPAKASAKR